MTDLPADEVLITHGHPDDAELAAVLAVLAAAGSSATPRISVGVDAPPPTGWRSYRRMLHRPPVPGADAWRTYDRKG
ncbi:acyl-CoA carboxylase epsilon subunit [Aestuariimicrobium soli]|uniref:acyl-CoA carboxylase epsilon subunit n=1 Tax=Aestuariimicrobium soli TaxID=2035834 RepID=UPI003EBB0E00